jgi:hypothetical protein
MTDGTAREHLAQAVEFLTAAEMCLDEELTNAATGNAVTAGIRAADAICEANLGRYSRAKSHAEAARLVSTAGPAGRTAQPILSRLLAIKSKAQYDSTTITPDAARRAVEQARKLVDLARAAVAG